MTKRILHPKNHTQGIHPDERPSAYQLGLPANSEIPHDTEGHIGYRCYQCSQESGTTIRLAANSGEYWQNVQLEWQEKCDDLQNQYDAMVAAHFPIHLPVNCEDCPSPLQMPPKPVPPSERAFRQNAQP